MRARYLLQFSYIGTYFRGAEKFQYGRGSTLPDPQSVQGVIEIGLHKLRSINYPKVVLSSRTDGGVHALNASAHVDLDRFGSHIFDPMHIGFILSSYFHKNNIGIQLNNIQRVSDDFSARYNALSRTYLFRIATLKSGIVFSEKTPYSQTPIEEWKRCYYIRNADFDMQKFIKGASYLPGYHDWTTFKKFGKSTELKHSRRLLYSVEVRPSQSMITSSTSQSREELFDYWDVVFKGRGFVHNQIRRIVGALKAVALNRVPIEEIQLMLQIPSKHSWPVKAETAPPHGLYLCHVEYDPEDLVYRETESKAKETMKEFSESEKSEVCN